MKTNDYVEPMPFQWRLWDDSQKTAWCEMAVDAIENYQMGVPELVSNLDALIGESAPENIDHSPLHTLAAMVLALSD